MALIEFIANYWYWALVIYGFAFAVIVTITVIGGLADARANLDADAAADSDSDEQCRTNLRRAVHRGSRRGPVQRLGGRYRSGDSVPGGSGVQPVQETLVS